MLNFKEWNAINEASVLDKIKNWLSSTFGGKINSLDKLANEYKKSEVDYVDRWEEVKVELDKLQLERSQTKSDPAELKKIDRMIQRNQDLITAQEKAHEKKTDSIFYKVKEVIDDNKRVQLYWEKLKTKIDADISEEMYKKAKKLADDSLAGSLYNKYKSALMKAKEKDLAFREKYGSLMTRDIETGSYSTSSKSSAKKYSEGSDDHSSGTEASFEFMSRLTLSDFTEAIKDLSKEQCKQLVSFLIKERNDRYVALDLEREALNRELDSASDKDKVRDEIAERLKTIRERYMSEIREFRSKITVARKYA